MGIPLRTYQNYENDESKKTSLKYKYLVLKLEQYGFVDEEHGILSVQNIKDVCSNVFSIYDVEYCYLFGSYAKGKATEESDVDLLISTDVSGIRFYEMIETLRENLKKKLDMLHVEQLKDNIELINEILKDGVKLYG
ncbi:MAG: nucleotidyltransferase domain-containing protein [Eubacteriales bacterium]|nr:nucleotidyltransferase domain-containing protein [Eubacteriales bacterium]